MKYLLMLFCVLCLGLMVIQMQATDIPPSPMLMEKQQPIGSGEIIGQLPGSGQALAVQGDFVFVGFGNELAVIDVTDKTMPEEIGRLDIGELIYDIAVAGEYAYLATTSGLYVINVSEPTNPQQYTFLEGNVITKVLIREGYVYTLSYEGLKIFDLAQAPDLEMVGHLDIEIFTPKDLDLIDDYAFILAGFPDDSTYIISVNDKSQPTELYVRKQVLSNQVALTSDRYMSINQGCSQTCSTSFSIFSWASKVGEFNFIGLNRYYFSELTRAIETDRFYAYAGKDVGLYVYGVYHNTTDIGTPLIIEWFDIGNVRDVTREDNYLYVISEDLNNFPDPPREGGVYVLPAPPLFHAYMPFMPVDSSPLIHHNK